MGISKLLRYAYTEFIKFVFFMKKNLFQIKNSVEIFYVNSQFKNKTAQISASLKAR